jgi:hypothetical protein
VKRRYKQRYGIVSLGICVAILSALLFPSTAYAYSYYYYKSRGTTLCLQGHLGIDSKTVKGLNGGCDSWEIRGYSGGYVEIRTTNYVNYCLDSNSNGTTYDNPCSNGANVYQLWLRIPQSNGTNLLKNKATGRCLDGNSNGTIYTNPCNSANVYQQWFQLNGL